MSLAETSIKRPVFISCLVALMLILGYISLKRMPVDLFPDITIPVVFVQVAYPGASPVDVEKLISKPIEDELGSLSGLNRISSNNLESLALIILEFKLGTDIKDAEQQIRNRIGNIRRNLPTDSREPVIRRLDPADQPVLSLSLKSNLPPGELYDVANEMVKPQFERIQDVGQVLIVGGRKQEVQVLVDKRKLQDRQLSMIQVARRITETSQDVPVGKIESGPTEKVLRTVGEFESLDQLKKVSVNFLGSDVPVPLEDIAHIKEGLEDEKRLAFIKGQPALMMDVFKQSGTNTVAVTDRIKASIDKINTYLKDKKIEASLDIVRDLSRPIRMNIDDVRESITLGIVLCIIVVFFFLGSWRSTFITGMALPNSLLGGFVLMYMMGFSINMMSLLALSLAVGLLIDDAIVVRENIFRHMELGKSPKKAALEGTKEVALAVIATTMVVLAVFGPVAFVGGMVGQFFKQFGLTVCFTMIISLFDAFTVAPMLSAYMAVPKDHDNKKKGVIGRMVDAFNRFQSRLEDRYEKFLTWSLGHRLKTLIGAFVVFVASIIILAVFVPKTFLPAQDFGEFGITLEAKPGTSLEGTKAIVKEIEERLLKEPSIEFFTSVIGSNEGEANKATMYIRLVPRGKRDMNTTETKAHLRERLVDMGDRATIAVSDIDITGAGQKPLNLSLNSEDLEVLSAYAEKLKNRMSEIPGLVDVDANFRSGKPEYHVVFDRERAENLGVSTVQAGAELRYRTEGAEAAVYRKNGIEYKIRVKLDEKYKDLREQFNSTFVPNTNFNMIPLNRVAKGVETTGFSQINRQNKSRYVMISANLGQGGQLGTISGEVEEIIQKEMPPPPGVDFKWVGQAEDFKDLMSNMLLAIGLGVVFIYLVLASLYESFVTPFAILLALPLAISGASILLWITGRTIDIFSMIGIVMLLGVVAKNSILVVDYTNQLMDEGMERTQALIKACRTRLRPILMTSIALIAGITPVAIGLSEIAKMRQSMGVAIIGGVSSSTLLSLIVVPAAFGYLDDFRKWSSKFFSRFSSGKKTVAESAGK
jgi:hydrophobic/amphiphilic exporter-1 (mainly G- bacteria), HAE1 family